MVDFILQFGVFTRGNGAIISIPHVGHGVSATAEANVSSGLGW